MFLLCSDLEVVPAHCVLLTLDYKHLCHLHTWQSFLRIFHAPSNGSEKLKLKRGIRAENNADT